MHADSCAQSPRGTPGSLPPIAAAVFDLFHTLIDLQSAAPENSTPEILGVDPREWTRQVFDRSPHHALGTVRDPYESVRIMAHAIDPDIPAERIQRAVAARPARFRKALLNIRPEILDLLSELRGMGLKLGLISNAALDEVDAWNESPLATHFAAALFSCHEGIMKPDPAIYLRCAARLAVPAGACLFVGDGGSHEHEGARAAGMRTLLTLALLGEKAAASRPRNADFVSGSFSELLATVRRLAGRSAR